MEAKPVAKGTRAMSTDLQQLLPYFFHCQNLHRQTFQAALPTSTILCPTVQ
jgi:hypothetical protein